MNDFDAFVAWEVKTQDTIDFKKTYVDIAEDLIAGLLLSQIIYWYLPDQYGKTKLRVEKKGHLWIAKGRGDWYDEIRISAKQFDRACGILIRKRIIIKDYFKFSGFRTIHIRLDKGQYMILWNDQINSPPIKQGVRPLLTKGEDRSELKGKTPVDLKGRPLTKNTTKTTNTPQRDFQDDVVESIGRHTDQEMLGYTGNSAKGPPLMVGSTLVDREIIHQIFKLRQEDWSFKQISEKLSIPIELVNDIFILNRFYPETEIVSTRNEAEAVFDSNTDVSGLDTYKGCFCGALEITGDIPPCSYCEPQVNSSRIVSTNVRVKTVEASVDYEPESCTCVAMAATGGMPPCSYCENSTKEIDEVETVFGPNPRQAQIDAYQPGELSREELVLTKLGSVDGSTRHYVKRIKDSGWNIRDEEVELGLAAFAMVTGFVLPTTKAQRRLWETGVREHLEEELFKGHLRILYDKVWEKIKNDVSEGKLTITHPKALTQWMYQEVNAEARPMPLTRAQITGRLVDGGLVELREFDGDRVDYVWVATGQPISEMSETFLKEQIG